jgi:hypothetical protein
MSKEVCSEERFLLDVAEHELIVVRDDGVNRHIRFKKPGTVCMHFDLITWPGYLCYTGDMGTYVFQRLTDMFEFFRTDREYARQRGKKLSINLGYWTEKLIAVDGSRSGGKAEEFCREKFTAVINEYRVNWMRSAKDDGLLDKEGRRALWEAVDDEVLCYVDDGEHRAQQAAYDFCHGRHDKKKPYGWQFDDLFEHDFTECTHSIVWCCYALSWGIQKYDESKAAKQAAQQENHMNQATTEHPVIAMHPIVSSQITSIGHDPVANILAIQFPSKSGSGSLYHYKNFTAEQFEAFKASESIGSHFIKHIKPKSDAHPYQKIG